MIPNAITVLALTKSGLMRKLYDYLEPYLLYIESYFGIARTTIIGIPVFMVGIVVLFPNFKRKKYDNHFFAYFFTFIFTLIGIAIIQIRFSFYR